MTKACKLKRGKKKCRKCYENENPIRKGHRATGKPTGRPQIDRSEAIREFLSSRGPKGATDIARHLNLSRPPVLDQLERGPFIQLDDGRWWIEGVEVPEAPPTAEEQHTAETKTHGQKVSALLKIQDCLRTNGSLSKSAIAMETGLQLGLVAQTITDHLGDEFKATGNGTTYDLMRTT